MTYPGREHPNIEATTTKEQQKTNHIIYAPYLAGLFEAGGSAFLVRRQSGTIVARFTQLSKNEQFIRNLARDFGGTVRQYGNSFRWHVQDDEMSESILNATAGLSPSLDGIRDSFRFARSGQTIQAIESDTQNADEDRLTVDREKLGYRFQTITRNQYPTSIIENPLFAAGVIDSRKTLRKGTGDSYEITVNTANGSLLQAMSETYHGSKVYTSFAEDAGYSWSVSGYNLFKLLTKLSQNLRHPEMQTLVEESSEKQRVVLDLLALHPNGMTITELTNKANMCGTNPDIPLREMLEEQEASGRVQIIHGPRRSKVYQLTLHPGNLDHIQMSPLMLETYFREKLWSDNGGIVINPSGKIVAARYKTKTGIEWVWHQKPTNLWTVRKIREAITKGKPYERLDIDGNGLYHYIDPKGISSLNGSIKDMRAFDEITSAIQEAIEESEARYNQYHTLLQGNLPPLRTCVPKDTARHIYTNTSSQ